MTPRTAIGVLVALVVIVVAAIAVPRLQHDDRQLSGFWVGTPEFLEKAGLSEMYLNLEPAERGTRAGHLVMIDEEGGTVTNQGVDITWQPLASRWAGAVREHFGSAPRTERVRVEYEDDRDDDPMPSELTLSHDSDTGTISLHDGDTLFAHLARDNLASVARRGT